MAWVRNLAVTALVALIIGWFVLAAREQTGFVVPPVDGFMEGQRVRFIHTEASDPEVAKLLTQMKGSPVLTVPSLANAPKESLANVYVFTNGVAGEGPFKFQPDVFDNPPGQAGYTPLRALQLVSWKRPERARELRSAGEVKQALTQGEIEIKQPGVVINMPMITWPDGHR
ncbi:MAG: hypothetical protein A3F74_16530 [Betaproteobacteria bacterium RIFCSPLOWO2_12_FULL_62_58]|nr:MAG: hypothetical protein A3F74_16530 [Betaproteobacteria bacterium RIFCSPLOWO2_12_FULL_62_58]